jgi:uncharacterized membrane protein (UPF0127 family)
MYTLTFAEHTVHAELALTQGERSRGLMYRTSLEENSGMLFVFTTDDVYSFWMKNTFIPLSIAFIDRQGVIVNIEEMRPHDERLVASKRKVRYALEMNTGWFGKRGIRPGMQAVFGETLLEKLRQ